MTLEEERRVKFYWDGLRYSFAMAAMASNRLKQTLDLIACRQETQEDCEQEIVSALLDSWTVVDMCHRVRELVQQTPGLSPKLPGVQVFLRATEPVEKLRHHVQHFRSGIPKLPHETNPLWGGLSWASSQDQTKCYTILSGQLVPGVNTPSCSYDTHKSCFAQEIVLFAGGAMLELSSVTDSLMVLQQFLIDQIDKNPNFKRIEGKTIVFRCQMLSPQKGDISTTSES
jgi:hypothetical protein